MKRYRVEQNPGGTWAIIELWRGGEVRSPFPTWGAAIQKEQEIATYFQFDECLELVETGEPEQ